jgi:hypothetical protein
MPNQHDSSLPAGTNIEVNITASSVQTTGRLISTIFARQQPDNHDRLTLFRTAGAFSSSS